MSVPPEAVSGAAGVLVSIAMSVMRDYVAPEAWETWARRRRATVNIVAILVVVLAWTAWDGAWSWREFVEALWPALAANVVWFQAVSRPMRAETQ